MIKIAKVWLTLVLTLTTSFSSNLEQVQAQNELPTREGYFYFPTTHQAKEWSQLTSEQQKKAKEVNYGRKQFSDWLLSLDQNSTKKQVNTTK